MPTTAETLLPWLEFQSAPAIAGGRCECPPGPSTGPTCFNPRPPLLAGDATGGGRQGPDSGVSIRARHCWRAMRRRRQRGRWSRRRFNPRPPLLAGDAQDGGVAGGAGEVSIRARHCWRAMPPLSGSGSAAPVFQSAPAIAGGRCPRRAPWATGGTGFNPRPPLLAGDAGSVGLSPAKQLVSIRARHCWRAMRGVNDSPPPCQAFQSAPAIAGGRCKTGTEENKR